MKRIWIPQALSVVLLLWALNPDNPYGYYIFLRLIVCACFVYLTFHAYALEKAGWVWTLSITAVVYNPIISIHLTREIWSVINVVTIVIAIVSIFVLVQPVQKEKDEVDIP